MKMQIIVASTGYAINATYATLPALSGSEKQIVWAEEIRASVLRDLNTTINQAAKLKGWDYIVVDPDRDDISELQGHAAELQKMLDAQGVTTAATKVFARTDSKFWIDTRGEHFSKLAAKA